MSISLASWRSPLSRALDRNRSLAYSRYLQLATVRLDSRPANRTVVFRGFLADTNQLKFVVDARSDKIAEIKHQPWAEACWYFPSTREQFRLYGTLTLVDLDYPDSTLRQARQTSWQELSDKARLQFVWPQPGAPRTESAAFEISQVDANQPLPNFCLLLLEPVQVDHLELRGEPQNRWIHQLDSERTWSTQAVNP